METKNLIPLRKKVAFETLGCRLNIAETGSLKELFIEAGYGVVPFGENADVVVINTCTVTDGADHTCRNIIRKARKGSPEAKVVVVGCYAQVASEEIAKIEGVDLILGTNEKHKILEYLDEHEQIIRIDRSEEFWKAATGLSDGHTRSFLKIQDGCNYYCAYCIIPFARGNPRSLSKEEALQGAKDLIAKGFKEIVLAGVNVGEYKELATLSRELLSLEGLERLRFSSIEPNTISDELLSAWTSSPKLMDYFHVPLQSGTNEILKLMRRRYTTEDFKKTLLRLKEAFPQAGLGTDIIVGFPGESDELFEQTYAFMEALPLTHFHVFPYSKRQGTTAATLKEQVPHQVKKERVKRLMELGEKKQRVFMETQLNLTNSVLFERKNKEGLWEGYTTNFFPVKVSSSEELHNEIRHFRLESLSGGSFLGHFIP